jgi:hypothetical protein
MSVEDVDHLPRAEFAFPGPVRAKLVASILTGRRQRQRRSSSR